MMPIRPRLLLVVALLCPTSLYAQPPALVYVVKDRAGNVASVHARPDGAGSASAAILAYETSPRRRDAGPWRIVAVPLDTAQGVDESAGVTLPFRSTVGWTLTANQRQLFVLDVDAAGPVTASLARALDVPEDAYRRRLVAPLHPPGNLAMVVRGPGLPPAGIASGAVPAPSLTFHAVPGRYEVWTWADSTTPVVARALAVGAGR